MAFKILNLANYHNSPDLRGDSPDKVAKRCAKFMEDVKAYNPTIIFLCYCFSSNGDSENVWLDVPTAILDVTNSKSKVL